MALRLFLDSGVIIEGCFRQWGASKAVLILATHRQYFTVVLAEAIRIEVERAMAGQGAPSVTSANLDVAALTGWLQRVSLEHRLPPSPTLIRQQTRVLLPVVRHINDLVAVVSALEAQPDWVLSTNDVHWGPALAGRTGLHIATPQAFLELVSRRFVAD